MGESRIKREVENKKKSRRYKYAGKWRDRCGKREKTAVPQLGGGEGRIRRDEGHR